MADKQITIHVKVDSKNVITDLFYDQADRHDQVTSKQLGIKTGKKPYHTLFFDDEKSAYFVWCVLVNKWQTKVPVEQVHLEGHD